jgi:hypothetical protein
MGKEFASVLRAIKARGNQELVIEYEGSGGSGGIVSVWGNETGVVAKEWEELEKWGYGVLEEYVGDYVNNAGGYGTITIDLLTGKVKVKATERHEYCSEHGFYPEIPKDHEKLLRTTLGR